MNSNRKGLLAVLLFLALLLLVTFRQSLVEGMALFTSDDPYGLLYYWKSTLPGAWLANWTGDTLVGFGLGQAGFTPFSILLWLLPALTCCNSIYALDTLGAGIFFSLFLRQKQCTMLASLFGAVVYACCSINFSLVHAGHIGKFGCYLWFAATLWALENAFQRPKAWSWKIATGAFLGLTVSEQPDLAILYVWLFVVYLAFRVWTASEGNLKQAAVRFVGLLALSGAISGMVAASVVLSQYQSQVKGIVQLSAENKQQGWEWATQWSYPPEETLELIAPGFFGWRIDEPNGIYWGRTGRSAEYDTTKQGFARFKLDTSYVGIVPVFFAVAMAAYAFHKRRREQLEPSVRREVNFWAVAASLMLLLAFGKYFLLYNFFYHIPKMNIIRNPIKFMHLFAVAIAILSAHGFHHLLEHRVKSWDTRLLWKILAGISAAALIGAIVVFASSDKLVAKFQAEFDKASPAIVSTMNDSLLRLAISSGLFALLWVWLSRSASPKSQAKTAVPYLVVLLATSDLYFTNRHYVEYHEYKPLYAENDLIRFLKSDPEPQRIKILPRDMRAPLRDLYNQWLTLYFPYHRIQTIDSPQTPRLSEDYQQYFDAVGSKPLRFWQLTNCKYLIGPLDYWSAFQQDPLFKESISLAFIYDLTMSNKFVMTTPAKVDQINPRTQMIARYDRALPRVKFYDRWQAIEDDRACLRQLASPQFDPAVEVLVSNSISAQTNAPSSRATSKVEWLHRSDNVARLRVTTDRRGVLLFNDKFDPAFVLTVDGSRAPLLRCNYIMKGALVEAGTHEVRFEYQPPRIGFYLSAASWVLCFLGITLLGWFEKRP